VLFGVRGFGKSARQDLFEELMDLAGLQGMGKRFPHELSGGERQRVALARALAPEPKLLLLDEPFSSLDMRLRQAVRDETREILRKRGTTAVFVTHDTGDALAIADGIVVLKNGVVQQIGAPPEVYHAPANAVPCWAADRGEWEGRAVGEAGGPGAGRARGCGAGVERKGGEGEFRRRISDRELTLRRRCGGGGASQRAVHCRGGGGVGYHAEEQALIFTSLRVSIRDEERDG
jgi:energy-coupling factor transporter ATP-binding protein EcfA2